MPRVDLHIHSAVSDGKLSPIEVVRKSAEAGLTIIALADHDAADGIIPALEAAKTFLRLNVIPAVEISTDVDKGELHVLGYFIHYTHHGLTTTLRWICDSRRDRAEGMIAGLGNLGLLVLAHPLTSNDTEKMVIELKASGVVGIEAYYDSYTIDEVSKLVRFAERYGLITTGGSDYHGVDTTTETLIGGVDVPMESVEELMALAER
ncbi:PHP domain-containing protein [Chloroflexota bacterium]